MLLSTIEANIFVETTENDWNHCSSHARPNVALWGYSLKPEKSLRLNANVVGLLCKKDLAIDI